MYIYIYIYSIVPRKYVELGGTEWHYSVLGRSVPVISIQNIYNISTQFRGWTPQHK